MPGSTGPASIVPVFAVPVFAVPVAAAPVAAALATPAPAVELVTAPQRVQNRDVPLTGDPHLVQNLIGLSPA
jgi:hypothetical protein